ncbi:MAG: hypothetical protein KGH79_02835 [Patescibacteria group bacterium]|nr:hypothetical protein [Patescibacteria group bacterium]
MSKQIIVLGVIGVLAVIGTVTLYMNNSGSAVSVASVAASQTQTTPNPASVAASSTAPFMQSTGALFSQYKYFSKSHEIFPTLATDTTKALGAFSYTKENLGNNIYRFTLTNSAEGYNGQSVVVSGDQSVYFVEPSTGDDSASEDSITTDDSLIAVDAQGHILK